MGVGGAFIMPSTLSILTNVFPAARARQGDRHLGRVAGLGIAIGPVTGGWLVEHADWSWIFLVNLPFVAAALPLAGRWLVPESPRPRRPAARPARLRALDRRPDRARLGDHRGARAAAGPTAVDARRLRRRRCVALGRVRRAGSCARPHRCSTCALFRNPRFSASSAAISLAFFALFGMIFFLTQYLQVVLGYGAFEAGLRTLPVAAGLVLAGPRRRPSSPSASGTKVVVAAGLLLVAAGLCAAVTAPTPTPATASSPPSLAVLGFGMGMAMAPATDAIMGSLPLEKASVGSAVNDATRIDGRRAGRRGPRIAAVQRLPWRHGRAVAGLPAPPPRRRASRWPAALAVAAQVGGETGSR